MSSILLPHETTPETTLLQQDRKAEEAKKMAEDLKRGIYVQTDRDPVLAIVVLLRAACLVALESGHSLKSLVDNTRALWEGCRRERGLG